MTHDPAIDVPDATSLATAVLDLLVQQGIREAVLCPGSRSAPIAFAVAEHPSVRLHTRIDERTAGFFGLGLAKASHRPVLVFCTSGTAAANLHPAVLEAAHAGVPLVVLTADRPASMRGTLANQTTNQVGLYGAVAPTHDVADPAHLASVRLATDGPSHLNVQFREPLVPEPGLVRHFTAVDDSEGAGRRFGWNPMGNPAPTSGHATVQLDAGPKTVVVAGDDAGPPARQLAEANNWPLFAEPSSGSRTGRNPIGGYRLLLESELGQEIQRVVVFGHPTLSRPVSQLLARDIEICSVPTRGVANARPHPVTHSADSFVGVPDETDWLRRWRNADAQLQQRILDLLGDELGGLTVAREVSAALPPGGQLFLGASNPIRDLDLLATAHPVGQRRKVLSNRGLAGIDGVLSSAIGMALTRPKERNLCLVGDVTFLHDANALVLGPQEVRPDLSIVVVNDDGGSIFATLEQGAPDYAGHFERLFGTPHGVDLAAVCAATRTPHWRVESLPELRQALAQPNGGIEVIEVRCGRLDRREVALRLRELGRQIGQGPLE